MADRLLVIAIVVASAAIVGAIANAAIRRRHHIERIDPGDYAAGASVVVFTSPFCHGCRQWLDALEEDSVPAAAIDIREHPEAAARYRISSTPRVAVVDGAGTVLREFHHYAPRRHDLDQILRIANSA